MLLLRTQSSITNQNAPIYTPDPESDAVLALGPSLWLEADSRFLETSGTDVLAWVDRVSARRYVPGAIKPTVATAGTNQALRMTNSPLFPEGGFETFTADGTHTLVLLVRFPVPGTEGMAAPGYQIVGANGTDLYDYQVYVRATNGGTDVAMGGAAINGDTTDLRDGEWHVIVVSVPATPGVDTTSHLRIDGVAIQTYTGPKPPPAADRRQMILGAIGSGASPMTGFLGGAMYIPGRALHEYPAQLATLEAYWMQLLADRST